MIFFSENQNMRKIYQKIFFLPFIFMFFSCQTLHHKKVRISRNLLAEGKLSPNQLCNFFMTQNPSSDEQFVKLLSQFYFDEANDEGINSDVAFAQMCLETGYLTYGNLVQPEWNNFCGLGAIDKNHPGEKFETPQLGVRAHIQHLQAYATTEDVKLKKPLVDPRYNWVHKTKFVKDISGLSGTWATDKNYAIKIENILSKMENF